MSDAIVLKENAVRDLLAAVLARTGRLIAPVEEGERHVFKWIDSADRASLPRVSAANSIKEFFFPRAEAILGFRREGGSVRVVDGANRVAPFVVFGARPCDAAGLDILDRLFNWDSVDATWKANRDAATVVAVGCSEADAYCFCTSVGLSPESRAGADVLLTPTTDEEYVVEAVTAKGEAFLADYAPFFRSAASANPAVAAVERRMDLTDIRERLAARFDSPFWREASARCLGCGVCTYYCPTCHCFDIQDESDAGAGARLRTWDSCSFALFTKHTSGHNPRGSRPSRWRQRIMHKFSYYPELFGVLSCTGCGRCGRLCPVDLGVEETLRAVSEEKV